MPHISPVWRLLPLRRAVLLLWLPSFIALTLMFAAVAANSHQPTAPTDEGLSLRGNAQLGAEAPVVWSLVSAEVAGNTLTLKLSDEKGAAAGDVNITPWISPWPHRKPQRGGMAVGLPAQRIRPGAVTVTGSRSLEPFGPVQRLVVQADGAKLPATIIQTRGQSGQLVIAGWRAVYAGSRWEIREEVRKDARGSSRPSQSLNAAQPQRLSSQGQDWCMTSFARAQTQESPPLLDWILVARHGKRRCPT